VQRQAPPDQDNRMPKILSIDDDPLMRKMILAALRPLGYEVSTAENGLEGITQAQKMLPDLIITDVMMPDIKGYEVCRRLRRDPRFARTPILMLTSQTELEEKLQGFEAGADDYMLKPFQSAELAARVSVLLRRAETVRVEAPLADNARLIAIQSLRGGIGCSSLAVNIALALNGLWASPTLLIDLVLTAGQVALMLNTPLKRTWADLGRTAPAELDADMLQTIIGQHESGLRVIAAPTYPVEAEELSAELLEAVIALLRPQYDYIVADLPHDFSNVAIQTLDAADLILLPVAPEIASLRAAAAALDTYGKLGYPAEKMRLILNWTFERGGLPAKDIQKALRLPLALILPFAPDKFVGAINRGRPLLAGQPEDPLSGILEDFAFQLSKERHKSVPPAVPSPAWQRLSKRMAARAK
jgi:pilus assembly protein CpaE